MHKWLLPEYIEDILSPEARRMEALRRNLIDLFHTHGYELIIPPLVEHLDSLLTGTGRDMQLRTFSVVDQLSGRMLGVRADISPQAARIDAHLLNRAGVTRLCYAGSVLHARPEGQMQKRELLQVGAELFGYSGIDADIEILWLLLDAFRTAPIAPVHLEIGHVAIYRSLVEAAAMDSEAALALFEALQGKDMPGVEAATRGLPIALKAAFRALPNLAGDAAVLEAAARVLPDLPAIRAALDDLARVRDALAGRIEAYGFDLGELRGYNYHTGIVFNAWAAGWPHPLARGGRYDEVGKAFGRARPATGFSMDLRAIAALLPAASRPVVVVAPAAGEGGLEAAIAQLRSSGEVVVRALPGQSAQEIEGAGRALVWQDGRWQVVALGA